jgi:phosphatidylethanolamine N-methyltransferase
MSLDGPIEIYGKIGCLSCSGNLLIAVRLVDQPANLDFPSVRSTLLHIVTLCLDSDPSLLPLSIRRERHAGGDEYGAEAGGDPKLHKNENGSEHKDNDEQDHETEMEDENDHDRDPDDFRFWSERQAKRISDAIRQAFGVEYAPEVILADANVSALANRVLVSKEILSPSRRSG